MGCISSPAEPVQTPLLAPAPGSCSVRPKPSGRSRSPECGPALATQWRWQMGSSSVNLVRRSTIVLQGLPGQSAGICRSGHARLLSLLPWAREAARGSSVNILLAVQARCQPGNVQQPVQDWVLEQLCASMQAPARVCGMLVKSFGGWCPAAHACDAIYKGCKEKIPNVWKGKHKPRSKAEPRHRG